jgi:hypothetical protein
MSLFISVLVVACNVVNSISSTLTPTSAPRVTLTLRQSRAPTEIAQSAQTPETTSPLTPEGAGQSSAQTPILSASLAPLALIVMQPRCYAASPGTSVCLGLVHNPLSQPVQQVTVRVRLQIDDQTREQITAIEQAFIPSGHSAPYRALFQFSPQETHAVESQLIGAHLVVDDSQYIALEIEDYQAQLVGERYEIAATIHNPEADTAYDAAAVITLEDGDGRLAGYRVVPLLPVILPGERIPFTSDITPQIPGANLRPSLHVEASRQTS